MRYDRKTKPTERTCDACGTTFVSDRGTAKVCSEACRVRAWRRPDLDDEAAGYVALWAEHWRCPPPEALGRIVRSVRMNPAVLSPSARALRRYYAEHFDRA